MDLFFQFQKKKKEKCCCDPNADFSCDTFTREINVEAHTASLLVGKSRLMTPLKEPQTRSPSASGLQRLQHFGTKTLTDFLDILCLTA